MEQERVKRQYYLHLFGQVLVKWQWGGLCNHLSLGLDLGNDIVGKSAGYFWQGITNSLGISAGLSTYIISDYFSKSIYDNCPTGE